MAIATILAFVIDARPNHYPDAKHRKALLFKQAERIAANRTVAGVHYPIDSWAGACLGREVARILLAMATAPRNRSAVHPAQLYKPEDRDYFASDFHNHDHSYGEDYKVSFSGPIAWLWTQVLDELI